MSWDCTERCLDDNSFPDYGSDDGNWFMFVDRRHTACTSSNRGEFVVHYLNCIFSAITVPHTSHLSRSVRILLQNWVPMNEHHFYNWYVFSGNTTEFKGEKRNLLIIIKMVLLHWNPVLGQNRRRPGQVGCIRHCYCGENPVLTMHHELSAVWIHTGDVVPVHGHWIISIIGSIVEKSNVVFAASNAIVQCV